MTRLIDLVSTPVLGRLTGINRKFRLRSKHYAAIADWPEDAAFEVIDAGSVASRDHFATSDAMFVVSDKLKAVLAAAVPEAVFFAADAGGTRVWVVPPPLDGFVMYESEGHGTYAKGGYQVVHAKDLRVAEVPKTAWTRVINTPLLAIRDDLIDAAANAGVVWSPVERIAELAPFRDHPYVVLQAGHTEAAADKLEAIDGMPPPPDKVPHPLGRWVRDEKFKSGDADAGWNDEIHNQDLERSLVTRFSCGLPLPELRAFLPEKIAKSKIKKRWKLASTASVMKCHGLFVVSAAVRDILGPSCTYTSMELVDPATKEKAEFFVVEPPAVAWMDWQRCDVMFLWSSAFDGYAGLHPTEDSYAATQPIVRVAGTNLILAHRDVAAKLDASAFYMKPVHEMPYGLNLDDYLRVD